MKRQHNNKPKAKIDCRSPGVAFVPFLSRNRQKGKRRASRFYYLIVYLRPERRAVAVEAKASQSCGAKSAGRPRRETSTPTPGAGKEQNDS